MRKLLLVMFLVVGMASVANAEVLYLKTVDVGMSGGRTGGEEDPLKPSDIVGLSIWLNSLENAGYLSGWQVDGLEFALNASGPGDLAVDAGGMQCPSNPGRLSWGYPHDVYNVTATSVGPQTVDISGYAGYVNWGPGDNGYGSVDFEFLTGLYFHCTAAGPVTLSMEMTAAPSNPYWSIVVNYVATNQYYYKYPVGLRPMTPDDFASLVINQVPEPITLTILGLGGLAVLRRRLF